MRVLGWIFFVLLIFSAGFLSCYFGLFDKYLAMII